MRPLSKALAERGWTSWFADREMTAADRPRRAIEQGLRDGRFGIVVLSRAYFGKFWPEAELDALLAREEQLGRNVIVPVLHGISRKQLGRLSPIMAGRIVIHANRGINHVADEISRAFGKELGGYRAPSIADLPPAPLDPAVSARLDQTIRELSQMSNPEAQQPAAKAR